MNIENDSEPQCPAPGLGHTATASESKNRAVCRDCGSDIAFDLLAIQSIPGIFGEILHSLKPTICSKCDQRRCDAERAAILDGRTALYQRMVPALYAESDERRLPAAQLERAKRWQWGPKGLVMHGKPGMGKTRILWIVIRQMVMDGYHPTVLSCHELAAKSARLSRGDENPFDWKEDLLKADALCIDDFGKFKVTERFETDIYDLFEGFTSYGKPILLTTNGTASVLAPQFSADRGPAILRRIIDYCTPISFL